jgi:3',5'-cyclic AMP phosphodiesterase CpdA
VSRARLTFVSDTHLSSRAPTALANWDKVNEHVAATQPDAVIHVGDLTLDGTHAPEELDDARRHLDRLPVTWYAVPGNHDIGDNPWRGHPDGDTVTADRCDHWRATVGRDRWSFTLHNWMLLGINAQLLGTGGNAEDEQWEWLEGVLAMIDDRSHGLLVTHKPVTASPAEVAGAPAYRFVPRDAAARLEALLDTRMVPMIVSGHVHQSRELVIDQRRHVWAPSTWATLPDNVQATVGTKRCGVVDVTLEDDGRIDAVMVEPPGVDQLMLLRDLPDPYQR